MLRNEVQKLLPRINMAAYKELEENLNHRIQELNDLKKNMIVSIEVLQKENPGYASEIKSLRQKLHNFPKCCYNI